MFRGSLNKVPFILRHAVRLAVLSSSLVVCLVGSLVPVRAQSVAFAWGGNTSGQLGDGTTTDRYTPVQVSALTNVVAIAGGSHHSLALKPDGTVWAWGENYLGQLGMGIADSNPHPTPMQVNGLTGMVAIAGGVFHSLGLKSDGTVWAWGYNQNTQLGDGTTTDRHTPVQVSGLTGMVAMVGGSVHSLALKSDGTVWAWGNNQYGKLGDGTTHHRNTPVQVSGLTGVVAVGGCASDQSMALKSDGTVWAWGYNHFGQLGIGTSDDNSHPIPIKVSELTNVVAIAGCDAHDLALKSDGTVWAWGYNPSGELGDGTPTERHKPVQVSGLTGVVAIAAGGGHSLAIKAQGVIQGSVLLQETTCFGVPIHFEFRPTNGGNPLLRTVNTGPGGVFSFTDIPQGTYDVAIKGDKWLQKVVPNISTVGHNVLDLNVTLLAGDADNNNVVDFDDLTILAIAYNTSAGDPLFDDRADFNCDGQVEFLDLTLLAINYNVSGDL